MQGWTASTASCAEPAVEIVQSHRLCLHPELRSAIPSCAHDGDYCIFNENSLGCYGQRPYIRDCVKKKEFSTFWIFFQIYLNYLIIGQAHNIPASAYFDWSEPMLPLSIVMAYVHIVIFSTLLLMADVLKHGGEMPWKKKSWVFLLCLKYFYEQTFVWWSYNGKLKDILQKPCLSNLYKIWKIYYKLCLKYVIHRCYCNHLFFQTWSVRFPCNWYYYQCANSAYILFEMN